MSATRLLVDSSERSGRLAVRFNVPGERLLFETYHLDNAERLQLIAAFEQVRERAWQEGVRAGRGNE